MEGEFNFTLNFSNLWIVRGFFMGLNDKRGALEGQFGEIWSSIIFSLSPLVSLRSIFFIVAFYYIFSHFLLHISFPLWCTKSTCQVCVLPSVCLSGLSSLMLNVISGNKLAEKNRSIWTIHSWHLNYRHNWKPCMNIWIYNTDELSHLHTFYSCAVCHLLSCLSKKAAERLLQRGQTVYLLEW